MPKIFSLRFNPLFLMLLVCVVAPPVLPAQAPLRGEPSSSIEQVVHDYILRHPEVLLESVRLYQEHERAEQNERSREAVLAHVAELRQGPTSPAAGPGSGITVVEFFDYRCGYCKRAESAIRKVLVDRSDVQFVFKEFPILGPESLLAAKAALAANKQGRYLKFHQAMMDLTAPITMAAIEEVADSQGLDVAKLKTDMESPDVQAILARNRDLGRDLGVKATPSFVIGSEMVQGTMDAAALERLIAQAQSRNDLHAELTTAKK